MHYETDKTPTASELVTLYQSVGWTAYTNDAPNLLSAVQNSTFVATARAKGELAGLVRALSDDVSILYIQDVLVDPRHQRNGVGRQLVQRCLDRFAHVRQRVLLTDNEPHQHRLYRALGFHDVAGLESSSLHAFVDILDVEIR